MSSLLLTYLIQFAPVIFGILFVIAMRSLRLMEDKIVLRHSVSPRLYASEKTPLDLYKGSDDEHKHTFEHEAYDALVENGLVDRNLQRRNVSELALEKLGFVDIRELPRFAKNQKLSAHTSLRLFTPDQKELLQILLSFKDPSGILLSYLAEYKLEVVGA